MVDSKKQYVFNIDIKKCSIFDTFSDSFSLHEIGRDQGHVL
jgi:hypothetical protein